MGLVVIVVLQAKGVARKNQVNMEVSFHVCDVT